MKTASPTSAPAGDKIRAPRQARSRVAMDRVMVALEDLLKEKSFDSITMQELVQRSGVGTSSIYARFKDKFALMLGVHERLRDRAAVCIEDLVKPARWEGKSNEQIVSGILVAATRFYQEHWPLIRSVLYVDDPLIRERQAQVVGRGAEQFSALFVSRGFKASKKLDAAVVAAVRIYVSVVYTEIMFHTSEAQGRLLRDGATLRQLTYVIHALLVEASDRA